MAASNNISRRKTFYRWAKMPANLMTRPLGTRENDETGIAPTVYMTNVDYLPLDDDSA